MTSQRRNVSARSTRPSRGRLRHWNRDSLGDGVRHYECRRSSDQVATRTTGEQRDDRQTKEKRDQTLPAPHPTAVHSLHVRSPVEHLRDLLLPAARSCISDVDAVIQGGVHSETPSVQSAGSASVNIFQ
jgi:hypothetical protein